MKPVFVYLAISITLNGMAFGQANGTLPEPQAARGNAQLTAPGVTPPAAARNDAAGASAKDAVSAAAKEAVADRRLTSRSSLSSTASAGVLQAEEDCKIRSMKAEAGERYDSAMTAANIELATGFAATAIAVASAAPQSDSAAKQGKSAAPRGEGEKAKTGKTANGC